VRVHLRGRGLHSPPSQLNLSAFHGMGNAFGGYLQCDWGVLGGNTGHFGFFFSVGSGPSSAEKWPSVSPCFEEDEGGGGGSSDETFLPASPPPGSFVARGPDEKLLPYVLMSPLTLLQDEVYTVYLRLKGK